MHVGACELRVDERQYDAKENDVFGNLLHEPKSVVSAARGESFGVISEHD